MQLCNAQRKSASFFDLPGAAVVFKLFKPPQPYAELLLFDAYRMVKQALVFGRIRGSQVDQPAKNRSTTPSA